MVAAFFINCPTIPLCKRKFATDTECFMVGIVGSS